MENANNKNISFTAECENCKHRFKIISNGEANADSAILVYREKYNVSGKSIFLTYYDCPSCGRRHFVQIDDEYSINEFGNVKRMFIGLSIAKSKGKEVSKKQSAEFKKARQYLSDYRIKLMKEYTGKLIRNNETDSEFVLRFSV